MAAHIGLVLVTQVLVAAVRHRLVAWAWLSGVTVAAVILFVVPDLLFGAELAFLAGSLTGCSWMRRFTAASCSVPSSPSSRAR